VNLLDVIDVRGQPGKRIELLQGDLTSVGPGDAFDLLIVSAFPDDYTPTRGSLIGALDRKGLSVEQLAARKELDLRTDFSCWLSRPIAVPGLAFRRILCFEPQVRGDPPSVVGDIFRALTPILGGQPEITTAAMPIVAAGDQGWSVSEILAPLLDAALHWMEHGLPLRLLKIVTYSNWQSTIAKSVFATWRKDYLGAPPQPSGRAADFDVFISYARENASDVDQFEQLLIERQPRIRIFLDRKSIDVGVAWQPEIFESLDHCRKVVAMFSPHYLQSKVCKEEFNIAWVRSRESEQEIIFPVYLYTANLPTYMKYRAYVDCREGDVSKFGTACDHLCGTLWPRLTGA
jgi:hypothetical protein